MNIISHVLISFSCFSECRVEHWEISCPGGGWSQGCVKFWEMCDGMPHCPDGSDEDPEVCQWNSCDNFTDYSNYSFQCESSTRCIWSYYLGDTIPDCPG